MAVMITSTEFEARLQRVGDAARKMERAAIREMLQDFANAALGDGDFDHASKLTQIIGYIDSARGTTEAIESEVFGPGDPEPVAELPEVQLNSDEDDAARLLAARPVTRLRQSDIFRD